MKKLILLTAVGCMFGLTISFGGQVGAASIGPSSVPGYPKVRPGGEYSGTGIQSPRASYVVSSDGGSTNITNTTIKIFVPEGSTNTSVTIHNYDQCTTAAQQQLGTNNSYDQAWFPSQNLINSNRSVSIFQMHRGEASGQALGGAIRGAWSNNCADSEATIALSGGPVDTDTKYRVYSLNVIGNTAGSAGAKYVNLFWLSSNDDGVIFSQDSSNGSPASFGYQFSNPIPISGNVGNGKTYFDTAFPFGTKCSITTDTPAKISFYDLDSGDPRVQPKDLYMRLVDQNGQGVPLVITSRYGSLVQTDSSAKIYKISGPSVQSVDVQFTAKPRGKYVLYLSNIFYNNTLQFMLPYESIYHYVDCQNGEVGGSTTLTSGGGGVLLPGQTATWEHKLFNTSTSGTATNVVGKAYRSITSGSTTTEQPARRVYQGKLDPRQSITESPLSSFTAGPGDVGKKICEWIEWSWDPSKTGRTSRTGYCVIVGKKPKINILGGDVRTGSDIDVSNTSISIDNQLRWYGSWGEYGVFANGDNIEARFGSGASLKVGPTALGRKGTNPLTFANTPADLPASTNMIPGQFGDRDLGASALASALQTLLPPMATGFNADLASISSDGRYDVGPEGVRGDNITRSLVIKSSGTVRITGNITYAANVTVPNNLPQVVIIAREIVIAEGVERVDAWLLTPADDGTLKTCSINSATNLRTTNCNKQLQVNGPVVAKTGRFYRTAGSDSVNPEEAGKPAEVMNLPASTYVWQYTQAARQGGLRTVQLTELPPRY